MTYQYRSICLALVLGVTLAGASYAQAVVNVNRNRSGEFDRTKTFPNGKTIQHQGVINRQGNGNYTGTIDRTGTRGNQQTYQVNGKVQRNDRTITNQQGQVGTFDRSRSCQDRTCSGNSTYATPKGNLYTNDFNTSCQKGSCTKNSVVTAPQGQINVNTTANRTGQGTYTIDRAVKK